MFHVPENYRLRKGVSRSDSSHGNNGVFLVPHHKITGYVYCVVASECAVEAGGFKWEHISVHLESKFRKVDRCPTWQEMCFIKSIFWDECDVVVQYHPAETDYVNLHELTLHLWRPVDQVLPVPPVEMV